MAHASTAPPKGLGQRPGDVFQAQTLKLRSVTTGQSGTHEGMARTSACYDISPVNKQAEPFPRAAMVAFGPHRDVKTFGRTFMPAPS